MAAMLSSRSKLVLADLKDKDEEAWKKIESKVENLLSVLDDIEKKLKRNSRKVLDHMETMRNEVCEIEDILETWAVEVEAAYMPSKNKKKRGIIAGLRKRWFDKQDHATAIEKMMNEFDEKMTAKATHVNNWLHETFPAEGDVMATKRNNVTERWPANSRSVRWHTPMSDYLMEEHTLEMKEVVDLLISKVVKNPVVSLWGVEGLGKTTMASKVYINPQVRSHFNAFAWVSLTQDDRVDSILQDTMYQLGAEVQKRRAEEEQKSGGADNYNFKHYFPSFLRSKPPSVVENRNIGLQERQEGAEEILRQKKCFIVFDGVLGSSQWQQIKSAFPFEGTDTRVLITTQEETTIGTDEGVSHKLRKLTPEEGWELLQKYVYHHGKKAPECGIEPRVGNEIVGKCHGLPSSICSIGRAMSRMTSISRWHELNDNFQVHLEREGQRISNYQRPNKYSVPNYDKLSSVAKQCFPYLAIFKENVDVDTEDLSFLWIAEGVLSSQKDATENNIKGLVCSWRQKLQMKIRTDELSASNGRSERLCLDNRMRELSLCQGEKEGFRLKVLDISDRNSSQPISHSSPMPETRRLVIHFSKHSSPYGRLPALLHLRSLFFLNYDPECVELPVEIPDLSAFTLLRIVHFVRCKFQGRRLPRGIENLFNLRYFGLLYCDLDKLPPSISNVKNLHVLNVRTHDDDDDAKITIPNAISQMVRLQHLRLPKNMVLDHQQSGKLKFDALLDLETLDGFNADTHDIESLSKLTKLRRLVTHAYNNDSLKSFVTDFKPHGDCRVEANLVVEHKCDLTSEKGPAILEEVIMCRNLYALTFSMVPMNRFPNCGKFASKGITQIKLIGCKLGEDPMKALGMFDNLQKLCLGFGAFIGKEMDTRTAGFPNLEYLEFRCLPHFETWGVEKGAMKKLSTLIIRQCSKFKKIPDGLEFISSLKKFKVDLPPPLSQTKIENYRLTFKRLKKDFIIRELDPLSAASSSGAQ